MRVLFVDEEEESVADGIACLEEEGYECERIDFNELDEKLPNYLPDIIVLDMMDGVDTTGEGGKLSFDKIWENRFCPIVVYSADPDLIDVIGAGKAKHPLVEKVQKGRDSDVKLRELINKFKPCVDGMNGTAKDVNDILHTTLRDVAPHIFSHDGINDKEIAIKHMGRRRISALMDDSVILREKLAPWEQYICPPLTAYPKMGDIILDSSKDSKKPKSFRVVLTPSCDLVKTEEREPKAKEVLCACCEDSDLLLSKLHSSKMKDIKNNLPSLLNQGYIEECLPVPGFPGVIPPMVANLKKLELISHASIGKKEEGKKFIIVASVDSPFREQVAWAYLNTSGRPGVPDRDSKLWAKQYIDSITDKGKKK